MPEPRPFLRPLKPAEEASLNRYFFDLQGPEFVTDQLLKSPLYMEIKGKPIQPLIGREALYQDAADLVAHLDQIRTRDDPLSYFRRDIVDPHYKVWSAVGIMVNQALATDYLANDPRFYRCLFVHRADIDLEVRKKGIQASRGTFSLDNHRNENGSRKQFGMPDITAIDEEGSIVAFVDCFNDFSRTKAFPTASLKQRIDHLDNTLNVGDAATTFSNAVNTVLAERRIPIKAKLDRRVMTLGLLMRNSDVSFVDHLKQIYDEAEIPPFRSIYMTSHLTMVSIADRLQPVPNWRDHYPKENADKY